MPKIGDIPNSISNAGAEFNYSVWTAGTHVMLCNVPWNNDYRDIVKFDTQTELNAYLDNNTGPVISLSGLTYAMVGRPVRINIPFNRAYKHNYLRVTNPAQPIAGDTPRTFYYFINDVRYVNPTTTELDIQLDVWQTFSWSITFGNCYIERGHIGIANSNQMSDHGREFLTIPEGLDVGGEYQIAQSFTETLGSTEYKADSSTSFDIIMVTTVSLNGSGGTVDAPAIRSARGSSFEGLPHGAEMYWFDSRDTFTDFVDAVSDKPWVSQGIIAIYAVPNLQDFNLSYTNLDFEGVTVKRLYGEGYPEKQIILSETQWRDKLMGVLPTRYQHLKKFLTYPYSLVELTTYSGTPLVLKPESMNSSNTFIEVSMVMHLSPPAPRIAFYPTRYNASAHTESQYQNVRPANEPGGDNAEFLDMVTGIMNLPTFSLVNNGYMSFLASNANSLAYQHSAADWSQQKAFAASNTGYDQASAGARLSENMMNLTNRKIAESTALANTTAGYRALQSGIGSVVGGVGGGPAGVAGGAVGALNAAAGYAIQTNHNNQSAAIEQSKNRAATGLGVANQEYVRDTNKDLADFAAMGDYANTIASINAKVQDARMIQPTTAGQVGGDAFNLAAYRWAIHAKVKLLQSGYIHMIGEFWLRYGYAIQRFGVVPADLQVMSKFTYWKLRETYITSSSCPERFKQAIRGIFEKGVTVWSNPADIGNVDFADNVPLNGVSL